MDRPTVEEIERHIGGKGIYCINTNCKHWILTDRYGCKEHDFSTIRTCGDFKEYKEDIKKC